MRKPDYDRRVVVTGLGVISSVGNDVATAWGNLVNGVSGLGQITRFDTTPYEAKLGGEVHDFVAADWMDAKAARRSESSMHFGVAAAKQALADSGFELTDENRTEVGVIFGSGAGGQTLMIDNYVAMKERGPRTVAPTFIANALIDSCSGMIAIETGAIGHNMCVVSACATGTHNVGEAAEAIRRGDCIAVISGSTEAPLLEVGHAGFSNMRGMGMPRPGEGPETVSRPFDLTRDGFVLGEGAGSLFLEDLELAKARGAKIYAEVVGYGSAADGWDMIQPIDAGVGSARAMKMALERRGVPADEVDLINPHGTSTPLGDKREAEAIWTIFGSRAARDRRSLIDQRDEVDDRPHDGRGRGLRGVRHGHVGRRAVRARDAQLPRHRPRVRRVGHRRDAGDADPLRAVEQHRPRRAQRRGHLQALRRRLKRPGADLSTRSPLGDSASSVPGTTPRHPIAVGRFGVVGRLDASTPRDRHRRFRAVRRALGASGRRWSALVPAGCRHQAAPSPRNDRRVAGPSDPSGRWRMPGVWRMSTWAEGEIEVHGGGDPRKDLESGPSARPFSIIDQVD